MIMYASVALGHHHLITWSKKDDWTGLNSCPTKEDNQNHYIKL